MCPALVPTMFATAFNDHISGNAESQVNYAKGRPSFCLPIVCKPVAGFSYHDLRESNLSQTCSCAHTVKGAWGILPACRAYKRGELTLPCICSSFSHAFGAGSMSNDSGHATDNQDYRSVANNSPTILGVLIGLPCKARSCQQTSFHPHSEYGLS